MEKPDCLAMMISDVVIEDATTHKKSLIGLFDRINTRKIPYRHQELNVFLVLTNGRGRHEIEVRLVDAESEMKVIGAAGQIEFKDPLQTVEVNFSLRNLPFPKAGTYRFDLYVSNQRIGSRKIFLRHIEGNK
jgi:hypothetical protein